MLPLRLARFACPQRCSFHDFLLGGFATEEGGGEAAFREDEDAITNGEELRKLAGGHDYADARRQGTGVRRQGGGRRFGWTCRPHKLINEAVQLRFGADIDAARWIVQQQNL